MRNINYYRKGNFYYTKCKNCGKEFRVTKKQMKVGKKYCNAQCQNQHNQKIYYNKNKERIQKQRRDKYTNDQEYRAKECKRQRKYHKQRLENDPEYRKRSNKASLKSQKRRIMRLIEEGKLSEEYKNVINGERIYKYGVEYFDFMGTNGIEGHHIMYYSSLDALYDAAETEEEKALIKELIVNPDKNGLFLSKEDHRKLHSYLCERGYSHIGKKYSWEELEVIKEITMFWYNNILNKDVQTTLC